jgi:hypothetical protein
MQFVFFDDETSLRARTEVAIEPLPDSVLSLGLINNALGEAQSNRRTEELKKQIPGDMVKHAQLFVDRDALREAKRVDPAKVKPTTVSLAITLANTEHGREVARKLLVISDEDTRDLWMDEQYDTTQYSEIDRCIPFQYIPQALDTMGIAGDAKEKIVAKANGIMKR